MCLSQLCGCVVPPFIPLDVYYSYAACGVLVTCLSGCVLEGMGVACSSHSLGRGGASIEGVGLHLQGEIPLPRPCQKGAGSSPFANTPNESWWPMLRGVQWAAVTHTKGMPGWVEDWTTWDKVS